MKNRKEVLERFYKKVSPSKTGCNEWIASFDKGTGYGKFRLNGENANAHRAHWLLVNGKILKGQFVLHKCDNRKCVKLDHLFLGTHQDNVRDCVSKNRHAKGSTLKRSNLKEKDIPIIRILGCFHPQKLLASIFGVSNITIHEILKRKTWKHI